MSFYDYDSGETYYLNYCDNEPPNYPINAGLGTASPYLPTQTDVNNYCANGVCLEYCNPFNVSDEPIREGGQ